MKLFTKSKQLLIVCALVFSMISPVAVHFSPDGISVAEDVVHAKKKVKKKKSKKKASYVLVTPTGSCYHRYACGRGNYYKVKASSAKASGLRPCRKCY